MSHYKIRPCDWGYKCTNKDNNHKNLYSHDNIQRICDYGINCLKQYDTEHMNQFCHTLAPGTVCKYGLNCINKNNSKHRTEWRHRNIPTQKSLEI